MIWKLIFCISLLPWTIQITTLIGKVSLFLREILNNLFRLSCQGFGRGWSAEVVSMRKCQKLPPMVDRAVPGSFKDPMLAKFETTNGIGSMSVITFLRKGKKHCTEAVTEKWENMRETALHTPTSIKTRKRRCCRHQNWDSSIAYDEDHRDISCLPVAQGDPQQVDPPKAI